MGGGGGQEKDEGGELGREVEEGRRGWGDHTPELGVGATLLHGAKRHALVLHHTCKHAAVRQRSAKALKCGGSVWRGSARGRAFDSHPSICSLTSRRTGSWLDSDP